MDWITIGQDIISNSVSGIIVAAVCGSVAWFLYTSGIKGKDREQRASDRKNNLYVPLKYEMYNIMQMKEDIWKSINVIEINKIVEKSDEFVVEDALFQKCEALSKLINKYNAINVYKVASNILCKRFEEKYVELYGSSTHQEKYWDEYTCEEILVDATDREIYDFYIVADSRKNIDNLFKYNQDCEDYFNDIGRVGPVEEYLTFLFSTCLPKKENTYAGIKFDIIDEKLLKEKKITPAEYMARNFRFIEIFESEQEVKDKEQLFQVIQELAFEIYEDLVVKIRSIGKKYEVE